MNSSFFGFYAHAGFLAALGDLGIFPTHVSGASAGALVAGLYAAGHEPAEIVALIQKDELKEAFREWSALLRVPALISLRPGATGALSGRRALELIQRYVGDIRIEHLSVEYAASVANLTTLRSELRQSGPLADVILASCAVPGMFRFREIDGHSLWDGGVADPAPFEHWLEDKRIGVILLHQVLAQSERVHKHNLVTGLNAAHEIITDEIMRLKIELARARNKRLIIIQTKAPKLGPTMLKQGWRNIRIGYDSGTKNGSVILRACRGFI